MMRDIPLWYGGIIFGLFALIALDILTNWIIVHRYQVWIFSLACITLIAFSMKKNVGIFERLSQFSYFTSIGGHKNLYFAELTAALAQQSTSAKILYIAANSDASSMLHWIKMYSLLPTQRLNTLNPKDIEVMLNNLPVLLIANTAQLQPMIQEKTTLPFLLKQLYQNKDSGESLFFVSASP